MSIETVNLHLKLLRYAMPACNVLVLALLVYGAIRSPRFRTGFVVMGFAYALTGFPMSFEVILQSQEDLGTEWFSKDAVRSLMPLVIISYLTAIPFHFAGLVLVLRQAAKSNEQNSKTPT